MLQAVLPCLALLLPPAEAAAVAASSSLPPVIAPNPAKWVVRGLRPAGQHPWPHFARNSPFAGERRDRDNKALRASIGLRKEEGGSTRVNLGSGSSAAAPRVIWVTSDVAILIVLSHHRLHYLPHHRHQHQPRLARALPAPSAALILEKYLS